MEIRRALISVSDKSGVVDFANSLCHLGIEILSTGGTAKLLKRAGIPVREVSDYTGFPEMLNGRLKTLHPKIHAGILAVRGNLEHMRQLRRQQIELIDMVVVNLYPFSDVIQKRGVSIDEAIENIDIGGPTMLRSAAKNCKYVAVICNPQKYPGIIEELKGNNCTLSNTTLRKLAVEVFEHTSHYDNLIFNFLKDKFLGLKANAFAHELRLNFKKVLDLRYGENPHQKASFYQDIPPFGLAKARQLHGKELSFNNLLDLDAAQSLVREFRRPAAVVIKHSNPCGAAESGTSLLDAFKDAWSCDRISRFGSIIGLNRTVDLKTAKAIYECGFVECIIAPDFSKGALKLLQGKRNLRIIKMDLRQKTNTLDLKRIDGGMLLQERDLQDIDLARLKIVTKKRPTKPQLNSMLFAWKVVKQVKSNAIVLAKGTKTVGIGAGQMSRVDSVIIAIRKAGRRAKGAVLASDAFFPKTDAIKEAKKAGLRAIIQPGGSIADGSIIRACDKAGISMAFTGMRHFKH